MTASISRGAARQKRHDRLRLRVAGDSGRPRLAVFRSLNHIYAQVIKSTQVIYIYIDGELTYTWRVSSGSPGRDTPNLNTHPNGRIYDAYTSTKFPGGDYKGLGNMPYAVFISGGIAIHGTSLGNVKRLGQPVSHGCIRIHPENGKIFNGLVRAAGVNNVWVSVQN